MSDLREALMGVFDGRRDVYAEQLTRTRMGADGTPERGATWRLQEKPLTDALIDLHLAGKRTIGVYLHDMESTVRYVVWDVDTRDHAPIRLLLQALDGWEVDVLIFDSGSKGYHLVATFEERLPGNLAYAVARAIWYQAGEPEHVDLFPRQSAVTPERPYGNQVKLPLGIHRGTGNRCNLLTRDFAPVLEGSEADELDGLRRVPRALVEQLAKTSPIQPEVGTHRVTASSGSEYAHVPYPCYRDLLTTPFQHGERDMLLFTLAKHVNAQGQPREVAELIVGQQAARCLSEGRNDPFDEWRGLVESVYERGYTSLGCEEKAMGQFCKGAACSLWVRTHNAPVEIDQIDPDMPLDIATGELTLDDVRQFGTTDPQYEVQVCAKTIRISLDQFASWRKFRTAVMGELRQIPSLPKIPKETAQETWERMVNLALQTSVLEEEPGDANVGAELVQEALAHLRDRVDVSPKREDLLQGAAWEQPDDEGAVWRYFMGKWIGNALRGRGFRVPNRELYRTLHPYGVGGATIRVSGKAQWVWRIKREELERIPL